MDNPLMAFRRLTKSSQFLIKWIVVVIVAFFINFVVSKFVYIPQHADIFSLIEVLFAVIVTALSIVSSFAIASQWSQLDSRLKDLDIQAHMLDIQGKKLQEEIDAMRNFQQKAESFQQNAENSFQQINASIEALTASSKQAIQSIDAIIAGADQNRASIESLEKKTAELTSIAQQSKNDIGSMKTSLKTIETLISQLGKS